MNELTRDILRRAVDRHRAEVKRIEDGIAETEKHLENLRNELAEMTKALGQIEADIRAGS